MKKKNISVTSFWDGRAVDEKTKLSRIMLTVNLNGRQCRMYLKLKATKADYDKAVSASRVLSDACKQLRKDIADYVTKAELILERLVNPSWETFVQLFKSETDLVANNKTNIVPFFEIKNATLYKEERFSTLSNSKLALSSLLKYKPSIHFEDIGQTWLKGYISFMLKAGNSITTANIYLRALRSVFNDVIKAGIVSEKHYHCRGMNMGSKTRSKDVLYPVQLKPLCYKKSGV
jgi:hypothetical protein